MLLRIRSCCNVYKQVVRLAMIQHELVRRCLRVSTENYPRIIKEEVVQEVSSVCLHSRRNNDHCEIKFGRGNHMYLIVKVVGGLNR